MRYFKVKGTVNISLKIYYCFFFFFFSYSICLFVPLILLITPYVCEKQHRATWVAVPLKAGSSKSFME